MEGNNIYEMLNYVDFDLDDYEEVPISEIEKKRLKKNFTRSIKKTTSPFRKYAFLAIAAALIFITFTDNSVRARIAMSLDSFTYSMSQKWGFEYPGASYPVNQTAEIGDYQIKISELLLDENSISFDYLIERPNSNKDSIMINSINLFVNGKNVAIKGRGSGGRPLENGLYYSRETFEFRDTIELQESNDVKIQVLGLRGIDRDEIIEYSTASFEFTGEKEELNGEAKEIEVKKTVDTEMGPIEVHKLILNPYQSQVFYTVPNLYRIFPSSEIELHSIGMELFAESKGYLSFRSGSISLNEAKNSYEYHMYSDSYNNLTYDKLINSKEIKLQFFYYNEFDSVDNRIMLGEPLVIN